MKIKFIFALLTLLFFSMPVFANTDIEKLENNILGVTYPNEAEKIRIERLEKSIYGAIQTGNINTRLNKLYKDLSADEIGNEIEPSKYTEIEEVADNTVDYPLINEFEKQIFNKEFKNKNLNTRLTELEKKVFNKTYPNDTLNDRTDRLKIAININKKIEDNHDFTEYLTEMPKTYEEYFSLPDKEIKYEDNSYTKQSYNFNSDNKFSNSDNMKISKILNSLEKKILKRTYPNQNTDERIERLEENMFNTSFPQDRFENRLERLALAYQATKSSKKYDTNKLSQHMATAMQVGMFLLMILAIVL